MMLTAVTALSVFSALVFGASGQIPGTVGNQCAPGNNCLDSTNQVCDTNDSPPLCKIRAGKGCSRQPTMCVMGASCQSEQCVCTTQPQDNDLCQQVAVVTESAAETTTKMVPTERTQSNSTTPDVTTNASITTTQKPSGAANWTGACLSHVIHLMSVLLLGRLLS